MEELQHPGALWNYVEKVYSAMAEAGTVQAVDGKEAIVWEGFTTRLQKDLEVPVPYYGKILTALQMMGCAQQLRRGGGTAMSKWVLWKTPTETEYMLVKDSIAARPRGSKVLALEQRVDNLEKRMPSIDVAKALVDLKVELDQLKEMYTRDIPA